MPDRIYVTTEFNDVSGKARTKRTLMSWEQWHSTTKRCPHCSQPIAKNVKAVLLRTGVAQDEDPEHVNVTELPEGVVRLSDWRKKVKDDS